MDKNKRSFLKGSGLFAGAMAGAVLGYREIQNKPIVDKKILDQVSNTNNCLTISQGYYPKPKPPVEPMQFGENFDISKVRIVFHDNTGAMSYLNEDYSIMSQVSLKPGPDGNLYIKTNGEWKQVITS